SAITGTRVICQGNTSTLSNGIGGGTWTTASSAIATIDNNGILTGNGQGVTQVIYELPTGCSRSANVTVNALPAAITGNTILCAQGASQLASATPGGSWSSSNTTVATVSNTGMVSGLTNGSANVSYTLSTGCRAVAAVNVNALPDNIGGATSVCQGRSALVLNSTGSGTWSIDNTTVASIDGTGNVTGLMPGTATIKYELPTGCYRTAAFTVNALPAAITGTMGICQGSATTLGNATPNGSWSSSNPAIAPISSTGSVTGMQVGMSTIDYTLPTGCSSNTTIVVNALPEIITGTATVCAGGNTLLESITPGGTWSTSNAVASVNAAGVVSGVAAGTSTVYYTTGNGCRRARIVTVNALPGLISGVNTVCPGLSTTLGNAAAGGSWSSDNGAMASVNAATGVVTAMGNDGTANIIYTLPTGCSRSRQVTVYPSVDAILGAGAICKNETTTMSNTTVGGVWSSSNPAVATISNTGVVTGMGAGLASIAYTMPTGCKATTTIAINGLPGNISGAAAVCEGSTVDLSNTVSGGSWSSSDDAIAMVSAAGSVTGVAVGNATMTYTLSTGCKATMDMVVNPLPEVKNVTGGGAYCENGTGVAIDVDGSQAGTLYKLMNGGSTPVLTMMGTGAVVNYGLQTGAGVYNVVAVSPQGCMADMSGTATVSITALVTPAVVLSSGSGSTVCAGTGVLYTATGTNGGTAPTFTWNVNGTDVAATGTYSFTPANGDVVTVKYTSNAACATPATVSSSMVMAVRENLTPAVSVTVGPDDSLCAGSVASFSASAVNGGTAPVYTWLVDGVIVSGATNASYAYMPSDADVVTVRLNSSYACTSVNDVQSNGVTMHMSPVYVPEVEITTDPGTQVQKGTEVTFTANVKNAGPAPVYQWLVNNFEISGASSSVYTTSKLKDGDSVTCRVTGTGECSKVSINSVSMKVTPATGVSVQAIGNSEIRLMPNPNAGVFTVSGTLGTRADEAVTFEVTDMLGQVVYRGSTVAKGGTLEARIELTNTLASGMYMLNMSIGAERKAFHFVVKQ
ncbi:Ig-like domain-containing protein, partial [Nemorincola caseinilytica]|uniref:Ig-like domain-containing protein n=1 Tax=Nemorincola caseinilytica TaxID=2054315 RepID=UPI0031E4FD10